MSGFGNVIPGVPLKDQPMGVLIHGQTFQELRNGGMTPATIASAVQTGRLHCVPIRLNASDEKEVEMYVYEQ